jgi:hypothetical protein
METAQLARTRRHAIVVMLLFLASIPAFLMVVTYMDEVLEPGIALLALFILVLKAGKQLKAAAEEIQALQ